ncbi:hypothetical protein XPA_000410 [Xanthoria parietina]
MSSLLSWGRCGIFITVIGIALCPMSAFAALIAQRTPDLVTHSAQNSSVLRLPSRLNLAVECDPDRYGRDLQLSSCKQALASIPSSGSALTFGPRGRPGVDVATPWRWTSADGKCAIEVAKTEGARGSYLDLKEAGEEMSEVCLEYKAKPEGAIATNIGVDGRLSLTIRSYIPTVSCRGPLLLYGSQYIDQLLRRMPAESTRTDFGRRGVPGVRVVLPLRYNSVDPILRAQLVATVDLTNTDREKASWYDIWAATVAIGGMCVQQGKGGTASWLGDNGKIAVTLKEYPISQQQR